MKSVPNYIRSNDGKYRATIKLSHRISKADIRWVAEKLGVSESVALQKIRRLFENELLEICHFQTYAIEDGKLILISVDDIEQSKEDGYEVYEL